MACTRTIAVVLSLACVAAAAPSEAQIWARLTNPKVKINVMHPPYLPLQGVTRVAVAEFQGECGTELTDRLTELIARSDKFEVLDRHNLHSLLVEQDFTFTGRVDTRAAVKLGKILGPAALIFGRVTRCRTDNNNNLTEQDHRGNVTFVSRTRVNVTASLQLVELATSRVLSAQTFDGASEQMNRSREGRPELPDSHLLMTHAYTNLVAQVSRLILPWPETVELLVYDDKSWNLRSGAALVKAAQFGEASQFFRKVVDEHREPSGEDHAKLYYKALYNLGVALTYGGDPAEALPHLRQSLVLRQQGVTVEAIAAAEKVLRLQETFKLQELRAVAVDTGAAAPGLEATAQEVQAGRTDQRVRPASGAQTLKSQPTFSAGTRPAAKTAGKGAGVKGPDQKTALRIPTIEEQLTQLKSLFTKELITQEEYDLKRQELLKRLGGGS